MNQLLEQFESLPEQNVKAFNELFKNSPLVGLQDDLEVTIGPLSPMGRKIFVDGRIFYSELVSQVSGSFRKENRRKLKTTKIPYVKEEKKTLEFTKEMTLSGNAFKLLYLLKHNKAITNISELAKTMKLSIKTVRTSICELENNGYVNIYTVGNTLKITLAENNNL